MPSGKDFEFLNEAIRSIDDTAKPVVMPDAAPETELEKVQRLAVEWGVELNPEGGRVRVVEAAVGDRAERSQFLIHRSGAMGKLEASKGRAEAYEGEIGVDVIALDDWIEQRNEPMPDLIKIDVEGGEALVLAGLERTLKEARPTLLIELHGPEASEKTLELLESAHYRLHELRAGYPALRGLTDWKTYVIAQQKESDTQ